jgi:tetratricopeptide (TPR) repeat protein
VNTSKSSYKFDLMRRFFLFLTLLSAVSNIYGQVDMMKYFSPGSYFESLLGGYQKLEFKWTLPGKLQVEMNEGINALEERNYEIATTHFTEVLKSDSLFGPARYYRGVSYKLSRKFRKAEDDFKLALKILPNSTQAFLELGDLYLVGGNRDRAVRLYQKANKMDPTSIAGQFKMGILSLYQGDRRKALKYFETCNKLKPSYPDAYLAVVVTKLLDDGTKQEAFESFNKAIDVDSLFTMGYFWRGLAYATSKNLVKAEQDWTHAIKLNPSNLLLFQIRGYLYMDLKKYDEAFSDFKKVMSAHSIDEDEAQFGATPLDKKIDVQNYSFYLLRHGYGLQNETFTNLKKAFCLLLVDKYQESIDAANEAQKSELTSCALYLKALAFQSLDKHDSAYSCFNKTAQLDQEIFDVHKNLAIYQSNLKNWKGAMVHLNKMRQIQPRSEVTWRLSGLIKAGLKDYYGALIDLSHYLKYDTADITCWNNRAVVRYQIEDFKGSVEDYQKLAIFLPDDRTIDIAISENYLLMSDTARSIATLREALAKEPRNTDLKLMLADKLIETHKVEEADKLLGEVNKQVSQNKSYNFIDFSFNEAYRDYVQCHLHFAQGKSDKAWKELEKIIVKHGEVDVYIFLRATIYLKDGKLDLAKKDLTKLKARKYKPAKKMISKYGV